MSWTTGVCRRVLSNGLTVLVQRENSAPVVAVVTHVKAGYLDEPDHWVGISHVLEHMFFKGTARRGPGRVARDTQLLGGYLNALTSYDKTIYFTVLPSAGNGLAQALDVQADALMHTALDPAELARELQVIIQEAKRKLDTPAAVTVETLYELLFTRHRMRRWRIGTEEGLKRLTRNDLLSYYETRYAPSRVIVSIVGDLEVDRAFEQAEQLYGNWHRPAVPIGDSPVEPDGTSPAIRVIDGDVARPLVVVGWRTVPALHPDAPALDVTASLIGIGRGSRLYRAVRIPGLASSAHASHYTVTEVGVFDLSLESDAARIDDAVLRSGELMMELANHGPEVAELQRMQSLTESQWARRFESMDGRAAAIGEAEALGGYELVDEYYERTMQVTAEDVREVAAKYLSPEYACAVFYLPEGGSTSLTDQEWPPKLSHVTRSHYSVADHTRRGSCEIGLGGEQVVDHDGGIRSCSLEGVDLLVKSKRGAGLVTVGLHLPGVPHRESEETAGISRLLARSCVWGAGGMNHEELAMAAELLGGVIAPSSSVDGLGWAITVRAVALSKAAELLRLVALEPTLASPDIAVERTLQASDARRVQDDMYGYPVQMVLRKAYSGDPYGLPALGDPETIEAVSDEQVRSWQDLISCHRAVVVAVGDMEPDALLDRLQPLASWPAESGPTSLEGSVPVFSAEQGFELRDKAQSASAMAFPAFPYRCEDRYALVVTGALLSGLAGRLSEELRERRSLAYTVSAMPWLRGRAGAVLSYIATSPEREDEAREVMLAELSRMGAQPVTESELARAGNYAAGLAEIRQQSGAAIASEILAAWQYGVLDELATLPTRLRSVSAEDVARVSAQVFDATVRAEYVVRGSGKGR